MLTFLKAQTASLIASGLDFLVTIVAVELLGFWYMAGTVAGTISGGIINFTINRTWVFNAANKTIPTQAIKYVIVWLGSLLLNVSGVYVITAYGDINYIYSKIVVAVLVGFFYNYIIQKKFVFR